jgi:aminoglycoside phosphotransferase (APT) family kinase protein
MPGFDTLFEPLADRSWPVSIQHGDCAPWNLLEAPDGRLRAVDWECGTLEGFPYLDVAYYILQTSALIRRRTPLEAARYAVCYLRGHPDFALSSAEAHAITRLAAYDAYWKYAEEGKPHNVGLQAWRRAIWEDVTWTAG